MRASESASESTADREVIITMVMVSTTPIRPGTMLTAERRSGL